MCCSWQQRALALQALQSVHPGHMNAPADRSLNLTKVVLHLCRCEHAKLPVSADDANLDVLCRDCLLKTLLQRQDGNVDGVLELHILAVPLLQEGLCIHMVLSDRRGLPAEVGAGWVNLEELWAAVVTARDHERDAEGPHAARLCELLHHCGLLTDDLRDGNQLTVCGVVLLSHLAAAAQQHPVVWDHACEDDPNVL
eukprot:CAMPEP_0171066910 /NCGR_PEP_ID=MMETSP0766_2-20121228/7687_1 /TAXON_ID=439317 /ORGANISM="Gambierdiscus australes, Strain CAWD 149" /LENGTH=196 /DNA_ID=CAMNT_0011523107 /DNA_START=60 /DNA_END=650 /DNA_ORIENTATION=-